jgi:hypothetical protein
MASNCCCDSVLDLGCGTACSNLTITAVAPVDGTYELRSITPYQYAESITLSAGDLLVFSLQNFNPNALHSFQLYMNGARVSLEDTDENLYDCLQLRTVISGAAPAPTIDLIII